MARQAVIWHLAVRDLHEKANWRVCNIAKAFGVDHAEVWWIVHKNLRDEHNKDMYKIIRANPEKWAKRVASQRAYYQRKRANPQWRAERAARSARNRAERRGREVVI